MSDGAARAYRVGALIDHHVHGCWLTSGGRPRFENALNEANTDPLAAFESAFDTQLGFAVRAHCGPLLDLPRHAGTAAYWRRRSEVGEPELARLFLSAAQASDWLFDTGFAYGVADLGEVAALTAGRVHEVVRLESVAEDAAAATGDYAAAFDDILWRRTRAAVATKSIPPTAAASSATCPIRPPPRSPTRQTAGAARAGHT